MEENEEIVNLSSPVPPAPTPEVNPAPKELTKGMDFPSALKEVAMGSKIHRLDWGNMDIYGVLMGGNLQLRKTDGRYYDWIISREDIISNDWIILK